MNGILERQWSRKKLCDEVEAVWEFAHLGDRMSTGGACVAAETARTRCGGLSLESAVSCHMAALFL